MTSLKEIEIVRSSSECGGGSRLWLLDSYFCNVLFIHGVQCLLLLRGGIGTKYYILRSRQWRNILDFPNVVGV
jgi:hypothetical protein